MSVASDEGSSSATSSFGSTILGSCENRILHVF